MALENIQVHFVDDLSVAVKFMQWLSTCDIIAIDTETHGLKRWQGDRVRLIQFSDRQQAWCIPWEDWRGVACDALRKFTGRMVFFNAKFDIPMIEMSGGPKIDTSRVDDVMVMAHIDDPSRRHALKSLSGTYVDSRAAKAQRQLDEAMVAHSWTWATVPVDFQLYWLYGGMDCILTLHLYDYLKQRHIPAVAYDLEMASLWVANRMEDRGARIDRDYTVAATDSLRRWCTDATSWCKEHYDLKPGSDVKIIERLEKEGFTFTKMTQSGNRFALDKEVLESIDHPLAATVLQYRRTNKLCGTYLENFLEMCDANGVLHPNIYTMMSEKGGAMTGRMSITEPALQTLPRKSENNPLSIIVRNCFIPRDGNVLVLCDFDQIEARMFAHLTQDPALIAAFGEGDFFVNVARMIYNDPAIIKKDPRRQWTKNGVYAIAYGAGESKFARTTGIPEEQALLFLARLHTMYPGIKTFQRQVEHVATNRLATEGQAYVLSPLTGRKHVAKDAKEYALVNYLIQGTAAEVFKYKLLELDARGLGEYMVLPVHDEIILDVPKEDAEEVARVVKDTMTDNELFSVPLTAGVDLAERWGTKGQPMGVAA